MLTYAVKLILELLACLILYTGRSSIEQTMDSCPATEVSRHVAWCFDADECAHGPRYLLAVAVTADRSINILNNSVNDSAGEVGAGKSCEDMRDFHAMLGVGV